MADLSGRTVKGYILRECIGIGGFGSVYRAHQSTVDRDVAIKVIRAEHANQPDFIRRFEAEAQVIARLEHPHIVPLYDYWREPGGAYLVMRWLPSNLRDTLQHGPWNLDAVGRLLSQVAGALHVAHRNGVVHRDIKPSNILLDEDRNAYLADFGVAKILDSSSHPTGSDKLVGSLVYSAPEQIRGEPITPRTDLYSLGLVLYELLNGQPPFAEADSSAALIYKHLNEALPSVKKLRPELPLALDSIIQTATAKDPGERYPDALRMAAAYNALIEAPRRLATQPLAEALTERELEILHLLIADLSNAEIADRLTLTAGTVKWYIRQIFAKLDVHSRAQAIERARDLNLHRDRLSDSLVRAVSMLPSAPTGPEAAQSAEPTLPVDNPYKGLRAFQEADAPDFFGRDDVVRQLLDRLLEEHPLSRFLAVVGPSGSGKSSIVRAGLIPALRRGDVQGSDTWFITEMLPGTHPFEELEAALNRISTRADLSFLSLLREDERGLVRAVKRLLPPSGGEVLLIIDQFEELFTLLQDEVVRVAFLDSMRAAVTDPRAHVRLILTLRADFYDRPLLYEAFGELVRDRTAVTLPLRPEQLRQAVTGPAERAGLTVEPALIEVIVNEVSAQPGALPMFQYALTEAFEQRQDHSLTLKAYQAIGGLTGALARRAEGVYASLSGPEQSMARQLFLRLVTLGEGVEDTRRRVRQSELLALGEAEAMQNAIDGFDRARLLSFDRDPMTRGPTVEVAHEAILREWTRLRGWLDESRSDVRTQRLLATAAAEWTGAGRDPSYLLRGSRLAQVAAWAQSTNVALTGDEQGYLETSLRAEQRAATMRRRVRRALIGVSLFVTLVMTLLALLATSREQEALREAAVNRSLLLASAAQAAYQSEGAGYALPLALEAANLDDPPVAAISALQEVASGAGTRAVLRAEGSSRTTALAFSADSRFGLSGSCAAEQSNVCAQGELVLWNLDTAQVTRHIVGHTDRVIAVTFLRGNGQVASASSDGSLIVWSATTGQPVRRSEAPVGSNDFTAFAFSGDGSLGISTSADGTLLLWDTITGVARQIDTETSIPAVQVAFSPDGRYAAFNDGFDIVVWDVDARQVLNRLQGHTNVISTMGFRPLEGGSYTLLSAAQDVRLYEWDIFAGQRLREFQQGSDISGLSVSRDGQFTVLPHYTVAELLDLENWEEGEPLDENIGGADLSAISPDGHRILIAHSNGILRLCDLPTPYEVRSFRADVPLVMVDVSRDGQYLLTGSYVGGVVILWDLGTGQEIRRYTGQYDFAVARISPDGSMALIASAGSLMGTADRKFVLVDLQTGHEIRRFEAHRYPVRSVEFSPDGRYVMIGNLAWGSAYADVGAGDLILWDVQTGALVRRFDEHRAIQGLSFSPDGTLVATSSGDFGDVDPGLHGYVKVWDVATGALLHRYDDWPTLQFPADVVWDANRRDLLVGGYGRVGRLNMETGQITQLYAGLTYNALAMDRSPDGRFLAAGEWHDPGRLAVWDVASGKLVMNVVAHKGPVWSVAYHPNGRAVFTGGVGDDEIIEWRVVDSTLEELRAWIAANRYVRDFTCEERAQYDIPPLCEGTRQ